jgi:hypothetical protein
MGLNISQASTSVLLPFSFTYLLWSDVCACMRVCVRVCVCVCVRVRVLQELCMFPLKIYFPSFIPYPTYNGAREVDKAHVPIFGCNYFAHGWWPGLQLQAYFGTARSSCPLPRAILRHDGSYTNCTYIKLGQPCVKGYVRSHTRLARSRFGNGRGGW